MKRAASIVVLVLAALVAGVVFGKKCPPVPAPAKPPVEVPVPPVAAPKDLPPPVAPAAPAKPEAPVAAAPAPTAAPAHTAPVDKAL